MPDMVIDSALTVYGVCATRSSGGDKKEEYYNEHR